MADRTGKPQGQSIARATLTMSVLTTLSRITGFGRVMAFAFALGLTSTIIPDSFNLANSLPNIIYELLVGGILTSLFIPVFVEYLETEEREEAFRLASALLNIAIVLMTIVTLVGIVAAPWIIKLYTPQLGPGKEQALMTFFLRFFIPQIIFYSVAAVFAGLLNSFKKFGPPAFAPVINNLVVITTFLLFRFVPGFGVTGLAIGTTAGVVCMALVQIPSILRTGLRYSFTISLRHEGVRKIARLSLPLFGYVLTNQVGLWIVAVLATPVKGSYAAYSTAFQTFYQLPHGIFALSIITALFPTLAQQKVHNNLESFRQTLSLGIRLIALTVLPAALGYIALSKPIITLTLEHGMFTANDTRTLAAVLSAFSFGLFSFSVYTFLTRAFYSLQDTRTPLVINVFAVAFFAGINVVLFRKFGVSGLAFGHAATYSLSMLVSAAVLRRRLGHLDGRRILKSVGKIVVAASGSAAVASFTSKSVASMLDLTTLTGQAAQVFGAIGLAVPTYLLLIWVLRVEETKWFTKLLFRRSHAFKPH